jgi:uncharacterized protein YjbI with pentapeptide repeats
MRQTQHDELDAAKLDKAKLDKAKLDKAKLRRAAPARRDLGPRISITSRMINQVSIGIYCLANDNRS